ncbi:hypothetical protein L596_025518 [Steinernema carpocapsae]|uniref:Uncharacterized protein n=1 Tax=Steinernema carpocapsae TaxID=34508 RepID=A0A4V5ZYU6_STECR|nr:hypothetical protein L596_025518 [Steinernema carpocapsae]
MYQQATDARRMLLVFGLLLFVNPAWASWDKDDENHLLSDEDQREAAFSLAGNQTFFVLHHGTTLEDFDKSKFFCPASPKSTPKRPNTPPRMHLTVHGLCRDQSSKIPNKNEPNQKFWEYEFNKHNEGMGQNEYFQAVEDLYKKFEKKIKTSFPLAKTAIRLQSINKVFNSPIVKCHKNNTRFLELRICVTDKTGTWKTEPCVNYAKKTTCNSFDLIASK